MELQRIGWVGLGAAVLVGGLVSYQMLRRSTPVHAPVPAPAQPPARKTSALPRPSCDNVRAKTADRLAAQLGYDNGPQWSMQCVGVVFHHGGELVQGLAIAIQARTLGDAVGLARGITTPDGTKDLVPFKPMMPAALAGGADLDHDGSDELMFFATTKVVVSRIGEDGFEDIEGPEMRGRCLADPTLEGDRVILTVPPGLDDNCYTAGRHAYVLADHALVETR